MLTVQNNGAVVRSSGYSGQICSRRKTAVFNHRNIAVDFLLGVVAADMQGSQARFRREWLFVHGLAILASVTVALLFGLLLIGLPIELPMAVRAFGLVGMFALLWFWVRMLVDFFKERPPSHAVEWGFIITLGSYIGALAYFWLVWRPRHRIDGT
jgi:hypothetical protein